MRRFHLGLPAALALLVLAASCAHPGAGRTASEAMPVLRDAFPARLQALQSVVIRYRTRSFTALGWFRMDRATGHFALAGMTPAGMPLFTVSDQGGHIGGAFAFPVDGQAEAWAAAMAEDLRRVFLDVASQAGDQPVRRGDRIRVVREGEPRTELEFEADTGRLLCVRWRDDGRRTGETFYEDWREAGGQELPFRIRHRNRRWGYALDIRVKELQHAGPGEAP